RLVPAEDLHRVPALRAHRVLQRLLQRLLGQVGVGARHDLHARGALRRWPRGHGSGRAQNASSIAATRLRANALASRSMACSSRSKKTEGSVPSSYSSRKAKLSFAQIGSGTPTFP